MCGIAGYIDTQDPSAASIDRISILTNALIHRGPDSDGFYVNAPVCLGMRRLKIIDLDTGDQPIGNEDRTIWTVFNGEIYNFAELRKDLIKKGHHFATKSDTEVIVHQYEEDGEACIEKFRGMFSIAIWDENKRQLLLARDRFGIKPLYVAEQQGRLAFASEMKALFHLPWIDLSWNPEAINAFLILGYIPHPLTVYNGIRKFEQGTFEVWQYGGDCKIEKAIQKKYWAPSIKEHKSTLSFEDSKASLLDLLKESVKLHLVSDVPLGAFLSGGIDSSSVVALMRLCGKNKIKTFSIGFEDCRYNETQFAATVAKHLETDHISEIITDYDVEQIIEELIFDEPFADSSIIPMYFVSKLARRHVAVSLSGDGGDELFAGYSQYAKLPKYYLLDKIPAQLRTIVSKISSNVIPEHSIGGGFIRRLAIPSNQRLLSLLSPTTSLQYFNEGIFSGKFHEYLINSTESWKNAYLCDHSVSAAQEIDQITYLADDILTKVDSSSMAVSLEARVPLLDHVLAEFINSLPLSYKINKENQKYLFKIVMEQFLPKNILYRKKKGFSCPMKKWLLGPLSKYIKSLLLQDTNGIIDIKNMVKLYEKFKIGKRDLSNLIWKILVLALWAEKQREHKPW